MSQQVKKISHKSSRSDNSLSKSSELRRYEKVYNKYIQKFSKHDEDSSTQSPPPVILPRRKITSKESVKKKENNNKEGKKLTKYQQFVKKESKKVKYRNMSPRSRLKSIGQEWSKNKE